MPELPPPLARAAAQRTLDAEKRVRSALAELEHDGAAITFAAVARHAHVSREFLYHHLGLRSEIDRLRRAHPASPSLPTHELASENSLRARLRTALDDNHRLREELQRARDELAVALGRNRELERNHLSNPP